MYILGASRTNDNPLASCHIRHEANLRPTVRHILSRSLPLLAALPLATPLRAQATTSLQTDATVLPRHGLGIRVLTGFARFDELLGTGGNRNLGSLFVTDSLTASAIPQLAFTQSAVQTLTGGAPFTVTAGNVVAAANSRVVTAPLILEYGLTSRLTFGVVVPLVETRSTIFAQVNPRAGAATVGMNPGNAGWATNAQLVTSLRAAATALQARLTQCKAAPSGTGCSDLLAQQGTAQSLIDATTPFASALEGLYGTGSGAPGLFFVPLNGSNTQSTINARVAGFRSSYQSFGASVANVVPLGAAGPAARTELQQLLATAGYDSLQSTDRASIGDITIGATYQLANTFADSARVAAGGLVYRLAVNAGARLGTGEAANRNRLFDNPTGYHQPGVIVGAASDLRFTRRVFLTALGSYTRQLGIVDVTRAANTGNAVLPLTLPVGATFSAGDVVSLTAMPRYRLAGLYSIDGIYTLTRVGADQYTVATPPPAPSIPGVAAYTPSAPYGMAAATTHQVGFGFSYSSSLSDRNPGRLPYEASFRHMETIAASGGPIAKTFLDQIQLRVFLR